MSALGLGLDLVEVESFGRQLDAAGTTFVGSTFTPGELAAARRAGGPGSAALARHLAARFAAKEAFVKAWSMARAGAPPAMASVGWHDIEVVSDDWGRPALRLGGATLRAVRDTLGPVETALSLTHEDSVAAAVVVITPGSGPTWQGATREQAAAGGRGPAGGHGPAGAHLAPDGLVGPSGRVQEGVAP